MQKAGFLLTLLISEAQESQCSIQRDRGGSENYQPGVSGLVKELDCTVGELKQNSTCHYSEPDWSANELESHSA